MSAYRSLGKVVNLNLDLSSTNGAFIQRVQQNPAQYQVMLQSSTLNNLNAQPKTPSRNFPGSKLTSNGHVKSVSTMMLMKNGQESKSRNSNNSTRSENGNSKNNSARFNNNSSSNTNLNRSDVLNNDNNSELKSKNDQNDIFNQLIEPIGEKSTTNLHHNSFAESHFQQNDNDM
jgi:hypothetical protein